MEHEEATLRQMLEYIYTNRVKDMPGLSADEVIKLLALANGKPANDPRNRTHARGRGCTRRSLPVAFSWVAGISDVVPGLPAAYPRSYREAARKPSMPLT